MSYNVITKIDESVTVEKETPAKPWCVNFNKNTKNINIHYKHLYK